MLSRYSRYSAYAIMSPSKEPRVIGRWSIRMPSASKKYLGSCQESRPRADKPSNPPLITVRVLPGETGQPRTRDTTAILIAYHPLSRRSTRSAQTIVANTTKN